MASYVKFEAFIEAVFEKKHNFASDTFKLLAALDAPSAANDAVKADLTSELGTGGGYTSGGTALTSVTCTRSGGTATVAADQVVYTASGSTIGPFRYLVLYNDTATNDELVSYWDYGSSVTLQDGETFTTKFNSASPGTIFTAS